MTKQVEKLKSLLFGEDTVFVVLDGASVPGLLAKLISKVTDVPKEF